MEENKAVYHLIKEEILEDILEGKLKSGDKLPSERDLAERYGVSRMTARHALSVLEREGYVERIVGSGSFVLNRKIEMNFTFDSFTKSMMNRGLVPTTETLFMKKEEAKRSVAAQLGIERKTLVFSLKRLRFTSGLPLSIEWSHIPYHYCEGIEDVMKDNMSLYQTLEDRYGIKLVRAEQYTRVSYLDETESKLLKVRKDSACLYQESVAYDVLGRKIEFSIATTRGDVVNFYTELKLD